MVSTAPSSAVKNITEKLPVNKDSISKVGDSNTPSDHSASQGDVVDAVQDVKFPEEITNATLAQQQVKNKTEVCISLTESFTLNLYLTLLSVPGR